MSAPTQALAVCGPTASGKTALGISLAKALNGEVVNIDSVQVYRGADVGSAKATVAERQGIPHHLLDLVAPSSQMTAGDFRAVALPCLSEIAARGKLPILVGGTGMYLTTLLHGMAEVPPTSQEVRAEVGRLSREEQYAELAKVDPPTAARLHANDSQRVSRALEIYRMTGKRASDLFDQHMFAARDVVALMIVVCRGRDELYDRINRRSREMIDRGLVDETRALRAEFGDAPVLRTIGYSQACDLLDGKIAPEKLAEEIALYTRRFAKRQMTFLRNEPEKRGWVVRPSPSEDAHELVGFTTESKRARAETKGFRVFEMRERELCDRVAERLRAPLERTEVWYVSLLSEKA